ncbi:MAG: hypothetical protein ACLS9K_15340 [Lachnospira eligens]
MAVTAVGYDNAVVKCKYSIIFAVLVSITIAIIIVFDVVIIVAIAIVYITIMAITTVAIIISYNETIKQLIKLLACPFQYKRSGYNCEFMTHGRKYFFHIFNTEVFMFKLKNTHNVLFVVYQLFSLL